MTIFPLGKMVLVMAEGGAVETVSGLAVVNTASRIVRGQVLAVGESVTVAVRAGDSVLFWSGSGREVKDERGELLLVDQDSLWARA